MAFNLARTGDPRPVKLPDSPAPATLRAGIEEIGEAPPTPDIGTPLVQTAPASVADSPSTVTDGASSTPIARDVAQSRSNPLDPLSERAEPRILDDRDPERHASRNMRSTTLHQRPTATPSTVPVYQYSSIEATGDDDPVATIEGKMLLSALGDALFEDWCEVDFALASSSVRRRIPARADSPDAPSTFAAACEDPSFVEAIKKEWANHTRNKSWVCLEPGESPPPGRRVHNMVYVFKRKRDGTCKARICVQGCSMQAGVDFDQSWAGTSRSSTNRTLCAYAARYGCGIREFDWTAAYLQGDLIDGEAVYCHVPPVPGGDNSPRICRVVKPIYGMPQAGRRLQQKLFAWFASLGMRKLDDSDGCVYVYDDPLAKRS